MGFFSQNNNLKVAKNVSLFMKSFVLVKKKLLLKSTKENIFDTKASYVEEA